MLRPWLIQLAVDKRIPKPIYIQIADEIITYIKNGTLKAGETLPGTRQIASSLNVNRNTVVQAFDLLLSEGWLSTSERKGSYVSDQLPSVMPSGKSNDISPLHVLDTSRNDLIFFDDGLPDTTCAPIDELARSYRRIFAQKAKWQMMNVASEFGDIRFREAISMMLNYNRSMNTSAKHICITRGSQMAFYLTAQCLLKKNDVVLIENPGFKPAWKTYLHAGARLIPIGVDDEGIRTDEVEEALTKYNVKAIHITPHHQYPTTVTLSLARRLKLIELSNKYQFTIIEDDYDNEYHFGQRPVMPVSAHEEIHNYVYVGTLSKLIAPAIRIGYIYSSIDFIGKVGRLRKIVDVQGDSIMEQAILELINEGDIRRHKKRMVSHYLEKRDFFDSLLNYYLKDKVTYKKPDGGLAFWIQPVEKRDLQKVNELSQLKRVGFHTPDRFSFGEPVPGIRLGYASLSRENLEKGIQVLSRYL
ncbi:GntR family transcriptional regulator/MocR family aminotransferase [Parabacteroides sp. PF5-5]|uniref:MocR-like pyridoxine biosynthesis transcription factor PdxR n=1 Tax=unclassified Parabacteroides TaxID=2649774 RepID=UPI00247660FF|nr:MULTISPECIES: PLP-dependent aminotransferase family protein [unclassified Parabacteroides]MDH6303624.1 GntR family transcriptional regulator/MocR family aminotransferase [Parabacteroides sp. PH5-39]MDH6314946.1 GntR family transcriptional regulator/MocR family aminotransferase [Parabacteroides sp. PF5-13]MDH6318283.1 GntR family transcriptional regulator/MocR family aminotransferase [Parabacteroides sp. PH5-13]MDH6321784.1 GntR family transcriptional regulator/MocR family aminotransferase [P